MEKKIPGFHWFRISPINSERLIDKNRGITVVINLCDANLNKKEASGCSWLHCKKH